MDDAVRLLFAMPGPNSSSWNSIITGYVNRGQATKALDVFCKMHTDGVQTLSSIRSGIACLGSSERNLVSWNAMIPGFWSQCMFTLQSPFGYSNVLIKAMVNDYGIEPMVEQCCSMIRVMGQSRELWRAGKLIYSLSVGSCGSVWRA
ncbi:hypothetical protein MLD38_020885 [Melastoma candidum]|uniref:Uncharacterized protein n=1 Tax=Melastoma candidum TaxID=119954 RepID=A0ACB9QDP3_9MYRT|nr:hypothetical protein MLD38_020885 [Melastoma candidum]